MSEKTKIFVSYKYWDTSVYQDSTLGKIPYPYSNGLFGSSGYPMVTPRSYLNKLSDILDDYAIEKWESGDNDLSKFKESTIESNLRDLIYDSSITIVLISPKMKTWEPEKDQWIPWEVSYSLCEHSRNGRTSKTNGLIALILPDSTNRYDYCVKFNSSCNTILLRFDEGFCFNIIAKNFFNKLNANKYPCNICNTYHYTDGLNSHYCVYAKWSDFKSDPKYYINLAVEHSNNTKDYDVHKTID